MKNINIFENHHSVLFDWTSKGYNDCTIIHIDSHHDMYNDNKIIFIDNYLVHAIKLKVAKSIYLVFPDHIFNACIDTTLSSIASYMSHTKIGENIYEVSTQYQVKIYCCNIDSVIGLRLENTIIDIDCDFFIVNGLGSFICGMNNYFLSKQSAEYARKIFELCNITHNNIYISISTQGKHLPAEYRIVSSLLHLVLSGKINCSVFDNILYCCDNFNEYDLFVDSIDNNEICLFNAAMNHQIGRKERLKSWISQTTISKCAEDLELYINWEFYYLKKDETGLKKEHNKCIEWFDDIASYNLVHLKILIAKGDYPKAEKLLKSGKVVLSELSFLFYSSKIQYALGDKDKSRHFASLFINSASEMAEKNVDIDYRYREFLLQRNFVSRVLRQTSNFQSKDVVSCEI
ncbi:MAG: hypothetical protein FWE05_08285 [Defluviitaleaceae bacterium]|nr:hypothetical protein [Defluviitaleaceae bacterium]